MSSISKGFVIVEDLWPMVEFPGLQLNDLEAKKVDQPALAKIAFGMACTTSCDDFLSVDVPVAPWGLAKVTLTRGPVAPPRLIR